MSMFSDWCRGTYIFGSVERLHTALNMLPLRSGRRHSSPIADTCTVVHLLNVDLIAASKVYDIAGAVAHVKYCTCYVIRDVETGAVGDQLPMTRHDK